MNKKKLLALVLAALMSVSTTAVAFADEPAVEAATISAASEAPAESTGDYSLTATLPESGKLGEEILFNVTTGGTTEEGLMVYGKFMINDSEPEFGEGAPYKIQYNETVPEWKGWHELTSNYFGPVETGFPYTADLTSEFKVTFTEPGDYKVKILLCKKADDSEVVSTETTIHVEDANAESVTNEEQLKAALEKGGTIKLGNDIALDSSITISQDGTVLDLGGYTLTLGNVARAGVQIEVTASNVAIRNGGIEQAAGQTSSVFSVSSGSISVAGDVAIDMADTNSSAVFNVTGGSAEIDASATIDGVKADEVEGDKLGGATVKQPDPSEPEENRRSNDGGDYYGNQKWDEVKREIADAKDGDTIKVSGTGLPYFPGSVARALKGKDITLEVRKNGVTYSVNGLEIGTIDKIWYEFEELETELLTETPAEDEDSSKPDGDKENPDTGR